MNANISNESEACKVIPGSEREKIVIILASVVIMFLALSGNTLILYVFRTSRRTKNTTDILIANLAVADLIFTVLAIPRTNIVSLFIGTDRWLIRGHLGIVLCKIISFLQDSSIAASVFTIVLITIDRLIAVSRPFRGYTIHQKVSVVLVCVSWLIGVCSHGIYLQKVSLVYDEYPYPLCVLIWDDHKRHMYFIAMSVCFAVLPLCLIVMSYTVIFINLRRQ